MAALSVLVDFDNVDDSVKRAGPVILAKALVSIIPSAIIAKHGAVVVRLYGGWRSRGNLTTGAQRLIPEIRTDSPTNIVVSHDGQRHNVRLTVELAEKPIGSTIVLDETFARDRGVRSFRSRNAPWIDCADVAQCGMAQFSTTSSNTSCANSSCSIRLIDILVRDEQKMVDTMIVADLAVKALSERATDVIVVSSDTDMWPGVMLALRAGCFVTQIHTKRGGRTQAHLLKTLEGHMGRFYEQLCV